MSSIETDVKLFSSPSVTSSDDEDIVFEGSPLCDYLRDLNINEDVSSSDLHLSLTNDSSSYGLLRGTSIKEYFLLQWKLFRLKLQNFFPMSQKALVKISQDYYVKYGKEIQESKVILDEDLDYLCLKTPHQFFVIEKCKSARTYSSENAHWYLPSLWACIAVIIAYLFSFYSLAVCVVVVVFFLFILGFHLRLQIITEIWKRKHNRNIACLRDFLKLSESLSSLIRRSIALVQELEVVSRGYKLVNVKNPIMRLDRSSLSRIFPHLRLLTLRTLMKSYLACRDATQQLLQIKLEHGSDIEYYICNIPLSQLGISFTEEESFDDLYQVTDGFSLAVLKSLNELYCRQLSEFLTRISLTLSATTWTFRSDGFLSNFVQLLSSPMQTASDGLLLLQTCYNSHKNIDFHEMTKTSSPRSASPSRINLISAQAHVRAALYGLIQLVDEKADGDEDAAASITTHLDVGKECWMRYLEEVKALQDENFSDSKSDISSKPTRHVEEEIKQDDVDVKDEENEVELEDQIYEGVNQGEPVTQRYIEDIPEVYDRKESASVIQELQSVLSFMTSEKQRNMWKQQLFPSHHHKVTKEKKVEAGDVAKSDIIPSAEEAKLPTPDTSNRVLHDKKMSGALDGEKNSSDLKFFKKPIPPGRAPSRRSRNKANTTSSTSLFAPDKDVTNPDSSSSNSDWTFKIGLGFSNDLSLEVINAAKNRAHQLANDNAVTYQGDVSDEET